MVALKHSRLQFVHHLTAYSATLMLLACSACSAHNRSETQGEASDSLIGSWKRVDWPTTDVMETYEPIWVDLIFADDGHLKFRYRPALPFLSSLEPASQTVALKKLYDKTATFEVLGDGKVRIELEGIASTYTFDVKGDKLYLTPPSTELSATPTSIYSRTN